MKNNVKISNGSPITFPEIILYHFIVTVSLCHFWFVCLFVCPTVSCTFLNLPLPKLIPSVHIHINTCIGQYRKLRGLRSMKVTCVSF